MKVSVISPSELGVLELAKWRQMQRASPNLLSPFLSPDFTLAVGRSRADARVAIIEEDQEIVGFFPHQRAALGIGRPIGAGVSDCQGLIHAPDLRWDPQMLLAGCRLAVWEFDHLLADQLPFAPYHVTIERSPMIDLGGGYEAYLDDRLRVVGESVKSTLRKRRKLEHEVGEVRFAFDVRDHHALTMLMRWKSSQYRRTGWLDRFAQEWIVELVKGLLNTRTDECSGTLSVLYVSDQPIAAHLGLRSDLILSNWFPAYDVNFSRYSPGLLLYFSMAEAAAAEGIRYVDLGKGTERYKQVLKTTDLRLAEGWIDRPSVRAAIRRTDRACRRATSDFVLSHALLHKGAHLALVQLRRLLTKR